MPLLPSCVVCSDEPGSRSVERPTWLHRKVGFSEYAMVPPRSAQRHALPSFAKRCPGHAFHAGNRGGDTACTQSVQERIAEQFVDIPLSQRSDRGRAHSPDHGGDRGDDSARAPGAHPSMQAIVERVQTTPQERGLGLQISQFYSGVDAWRIPAASNEVYLLPTQLD